MSPKPHPKNSPWDFPGGPVVGTSPSNTRDVGSIPGRGTNIPHASQPHSKTKRNIKQKQYCDKLNKDFKMFHIKKKKKNLKKNTKNSSLESHCPGKKHINVKGGQWLRLCHLKQWVSVRSQVRELGVHVPRGQKKSQNIKQKQLCNKFNKD